MFGVSKMKTVEKQKSNDNFLGISLLYHSKRVVRFPSTSASLSHAVESMFFSLRQYTMTLIAMIVR